jgi:hypothetical protein
MAMSSAKVPVECEHSLGELLYRARIIEGLARSLVGLRIEWFIGWMLPR